MREEADRGRERSQIPFSERGRVTAVRRTAARKPIRGPSSVNVSCSRWSEPGGYREVLKIAIPLILSTGAWSIQHFVDRMFLSWYSPEAIAAAMPAGMLNFALLSIFIGTVSYVSTFVAQYHGAGRHREIGPVLWQGMYVSLFGGLCMLCLIPLAGSIFALVGHDAPVQKNEVDYFVILSIGGFPAIATHALSGFFSGVARPWPIMWVTMASTALNLILDYLFIFGRAGLPEMGMRGAALATVLAAVFSLVVMLLLAWRAANDTRYHTLKGWRPDGALMRRLLRFGFPSGMQFFLDMSGFTGFILLVGRLGTLPLAATNIAFNINTLAFMPMIGCGITVSVLVGQHLGRNAPELAEKATWSAFHITFAYMASIAAAYVLIPEVFVAPFAPADDPQAFEAIFHLAVILLRFVALYSIFDTLSIVFASAVKGAGDTRFVMLIIAAFSGLILLGPAYVTIVVLGRGIMAAWILATLYVTSLGIVFLLRFLQGKWKTMRVIESEKTWATSDISPVLEQSSTPQRFPIPKTGFRPGRQPVPILQQGALQDACRFNPPGPATGPNGLGTPGVEPGAGSCGRRLDDQNAP
ncbi:MATE efflux family protein (modular protein) [uncultured Desulfatiglans sp.]|uniref:MATE efflux family protein (Modular protein) n=1 Tax=Uncultured Desulfatiglans sp. TaxID=1748965 RepID=A0A653A528_UNCDX|nr:MATE efflux family protein (modular protein) [uncultured Desulfatiglans sp.]